MQAVLDAFVSEAQWQETVIAAAEACGWQWFCLPDWMYRNGIQQARRNPRRGYRWPKPGFPDLVLMRPDPATGQARTLFVELKAQAGTVRPEQRAWLAGLRASGLDVRVWRPADWPTVLATLRGEEATDAVA